MFVGVKVTSPKFSEKQEELLIDWELRLGDVTVRSAVIDLTILLIRIFDFGYFCQEKLDFEDFRNLYVGCNGYLKVMG